MKYTIATKLLVLYSLFLIFGCHKKDENSKPAVPSPIIIDVIIAKKQSFSREIEAIGSIVAKEFVELHPEISGRLTYLNVPEGNTVTQGTVIAKINSADLQAQLFRSKSQLALAQKTEERTAILLSINGVNQSDYDIAVNQVNTLKGDIAYTEAMIDKTIIKAPFSGTIGLRQVSPGAYLTPVSIISTLQQTDVLKVDFTVPEEYGNLLQKGKFVEVKLDKAGKENEEQRQKAKIIAIEPQVSATTRNLSVRAILQNAKANPGSFVKVYLNAGNDKKSIVVPSNAIIPEDKNKTIVVVKNSKATFIKAETGQRQAGGVEILNGLKEGDSVVVTGVLFLRPDADVKVKSVKNIEDLIR